MSAGAETWLDALPPLRDVIARHQLGARHGLGQHFLLDQNICAKIARSAGIEDGETVVEVGPGPGGLTRALLATSAARIVAVERDARCVAALQDLAEAATGRLAIVSGDALAYDIADAGPAPRRIVANLPYNISTPLLIGWLQRIGDIASMTLMFQREVADRLTAACGGRAYGRLSILTQWLCEVRRVFDLPAAAFVPPPKVTSSVVQLVPRAAPLAPADTGLLQEVTAAAFGQRRKMLRSSLKQLRVDTEALLAEAGVAPTARAETVDVAGMCAIARALEQLRGGAS